MAITATSFAGYNLCAVEIIKNDECGVPEVGLLNLAVVEGMTSLGLAQVNSTIQEFERKNSCDELLYEIVSLTDPFKRYDVTWNFDVIDYCALNLLAGVSLDVDGASANKGFDMKPGSAATNVSIRGWGLIPGDQCLGGTQEYVVFELPQLVGTRVTGFGDLSADAHTVTLSGRTRGAAATYGDGPLDMANSDIPAGTHLRVYRTTTAPPVVSDGCIEYAAPI